MGLGNGYIYHMIPENKRFTFFRKNSMGIGTWTIWYEGHTIYYSHALVEGGSEQVHPEVVTLNNSGRTIEQQIELQMRSRLSRMLDKGYKATRDEALQGATNQLGFVNPMLAHPITKVAQPIISPRAHVQIKYNGHRTLVTRHEGRLVPYTRKGKLIETIDHILEPLDKVLPEGATLDGELYVPGMALQGISSLIKRKQSGNAQLKLHVYDIVEPTPYIDRLASLRSLLGPIECEKVFVVPTHEVTSIEEVYSLFRIFRKAGHEGAMLRISLRGYEDGKRSDQLLKVKETLDEDFKVVGMKAGKYDIAILVLQLNDRPGTFDCTAPGPVPMKQLILKESEKYIGRWVEVAFAEKTNDGVPFHGVAIQFKEEL